MINEANITYVHVFPYSHRNGTAASKMPKVLNADIKKRAKDLRKLSEAQNKKFLLNQVGTIQSVLVEKNSIGYTPYFSKIKLNEDVKSNEIISSHIVDTNSEGLIGSVYQDHPKQ